MRSNSSQFYVQRNFSVLWCLLGDSAFSATGLMVPNYGLVQLGWFRHFVLQKVGSRLNSVINRIPILWCHQVIIKSSSMVEKTMCCSACVVLHKMHVGQGTWHSWWLVCRVYAWTWMMTTKALEVDAQSQVVVDVIGYFTTVSNYILNFFGQA